MYCLSISQHRHITQLDEGLVVICAVRFEDAYETYDRLDTYLYEHLGSHKWNASKNGFLATEGTLGGSTPGSSFAKEMILVPSTSKQRSVYGAPIRLHTSVSGLQQTLFPLNLISNTDIPDSFG